MRLRSTDSQEQDCREWCEREGWQIKEVVVDAHRSATQWARRPREGFSRILKELPGVDVLVMWEASRAAREMEGYVALKKELVEAGTLLAYSGRVYDLSRGDDAFAAGLDALVAEREAAIIRDRIVRSVRQRTVAGKPHGAIAYGYQREYDPSSGHLLGQVPDPVTSKIVKEMTRRVLLGEPLSRIAKDLNERGVPTPKPPRKEGSRGWTASSVRQVLRQPSLTGLRQHKGEVIGEATWPAIIEREKWEKLQAHLTRPDRVSHRGSRPVHLLSWIARCGSCGAPMTSGMTNGKRYRALRCSSDHCPKHPTIVQDKAEDFIKDLVARYLAQQAGKLTQGADSAGLTDGPEGDSLREELSTLRERLQEAADQYSEGNLSATMLAAVEKRIQPRIEEIDRELRPKVSDPAVERVVQAEDPAQAWKKAPLLVQRSLLRALFDIRVDPSASKGGRFNSRRIRVTRA